MELNVFLNHCLLVGHSVKESPLNGLCTGESALHDLVLQLRTAVSDCLLNKLLAVRSRKHLAAELEKEKGTEIR